MSRVIGIAILAAGIYLFYQAFDGFNPLMDRIANLLTGKGGMDQTLWYDVGGLACVVVGLVVANSSRPD